MGNVPKFRILLVLVVLLLCCSIVFGVWADTDGDGIDDLLLTEEPVFDVFFARYFDVQIRNTSDSDPWTTDPFFEKLSPKVRLNHPTKSGKVNMEGRITIAEDGYLILDNKAQWGSLIILDKEGTGNHQVIHSTASWACPVKVSRDANGRVNRRPLCIYSRDGTLLYSYHIGSQISAAGNRVGIARQYSAVLTQTITQNACGVDTFSVVRKLDRGSYFCGNASTRIELKKGDVLYFSGGNDNIIGKGGSGIEIHYYGICDNNPDLDNSENQCSLCPIHVGFNNNNQTDWDPGLACCGDDGDDCGMFFGSTLCADTFTNNDGVHFSFTDATQNSGAVLEASCDVEPLTYLSTSTEWVLCAGNNTLVKTGQKTFELNADATPQALTVQNPIAVNGNEYACHDLNGKMTLTECCGNGQCNKDSTNLFGGNSKSTAQSITLPLSTGSDTFFCTDSGQYTQSLDQHETICKSSTFPDGSPTRFTWTENNRCCGETAGETYDNQGGAGACLDGKYVSNNDGPLTQFPNIKVIDGQFYECALASYQDPLRSLVISANQCFQDTNTNWYCDVDGLWKQSNSDVSHLKGVPQAWQNDPTVNTFQGCCAQDQCWDGASCINDQSSFQPGSIQGNPPKGDGFRCIVGEWKITPLKSAPDSSKRLTPDDFPDQGYCPEDTQCFVSLSGDHLDNNDPSKNPQCIASGQFKDDDYCSDGSWQTRTQMLAYTLLNQVNPGEDYTLYCGPYDDTLNYFDYFLTYQGGIGDASFLFGANFANHVCLLEHNGNTIMGTSLNDDIAFWMSELEVLFPGFRGCQANAVTGFGSCDGQLSSTSWVDSGLGIALYSRTPFILDQNPKNTFQNHVNRPFFTDILPSLQSSTATNGFDYTFSNNGLTFNWAFMKQQGANSAFATIDEGKLVATYSSVDEDRFCDVVNEYRRQNVDSQSQSDIACLKTPSQAYLVMDGFSSGADINPYNLWSDISGKLRYS